MDHRDLDLNKWNPFKFARKTSEEKRGQPSSSAAMGGNVGTFPTAWPNWPRLFMANPFRLMQDMLREPSAGPGQLDRWFGDFSPSAFQPRIDVVDDGDALRITAELPGMDREDVQIQLEDDALVLRGEKKLETKNEEKGCYRLQRAFRSFRRVIPLSGGVDVEHANANFDKGTLTIRLPKLAAEKSRVRQLEIK